MDTTVEGKTRSENVGKPVAIHVETMEDLRLIEALMKGTKGMRAEGRTFLPQEEVESDPAYKNRLNRSILLEAFNRTIQRLTGEVFSKAIVFSNDLNEDIKNWCNDVDGEGKNIDRFSWEVFSAALSLGFTFLLVDYPAVELIKNENKYYFIDEDGNTILLTEAVKKEKGWKPYVIHVLPENLIGWKFETVNGKKTLVQIRIREITEEDDGDYGLINVERIRVLNLNSWELWIKREEKVGNIVNVFYELEKTGQTTLNEITLVPIFFGRKTSAMTTDAPLQGLADLNLLHWQSSSDQRNILHYARLVIYFGKLLRQDTKTKKIKFGANQLIHGNDEKSDLKVVEHNGNAIESGRKDLKDLEELMGMYGLTQMMPKTGNITATGRAIDSSESNSALKTYAMVFNDAWNQALYYVKLFFNIAKEAKIGSIVINTEFSNIISDASADVLVKACSEMILSKQLVFDEFKRRGLVSSEIDFETMFQDMLKEQEDSNAVSAPVAEKGLFDKE